MSQNKHKRLLWFIFKLHYTNHEERKITALHYGHDLNKKLGLGLTRECIDILYSVPAVQTFGAGSVPVMRPRPPISSRALPTVRLPVWGGRGDRGPGLYTWNASCLVEALPLFCVFEKLCTDPQVKWKGLWYRTQRSWEMEPTKFKIYLLRFKSLQ